MASPTSGYTTRELSQETWPDFERLFSRGNGWDHCWCMAFQRQRSLSWKGRTRAELSVRNHEEKRELVEQVNAHGVLVYANNEPVGWCQFGPQDELAVPANRRNTAKQTTQGADKLWRITCFVTDKKYRRKGVAGVALMAALEAIRKRGGGLVEAYPIAHWGVDRELGGLSRKYGSGSVEVRGHRETRVPIPDLIVQGVGPVAAAHGTFGNLSTQGTVSMFEKAVFKAVAVVSRTHVVMQKTV